ncbi:MAG: sulfite exporter TauE/SafE family protein [Anaerolineae bacterium]|nr:sulfite exporter TauE/SafE family protein [Anaerolineae bacterium]
MTPSIAIAIIVFLAILTQAIAGSGLALIAMPLLVEILDPLTAASLVALMAITTQLIMLARYRQSLSAQGLWRLMVGSLLGIPIGIYALSQLDEQVILTVLGLVLISYVAINLFTLPLPPFRNANWGFGFGFLSGMLGGAYNTGGPPFVIYGLSQKWEPQRFKANLQLLLMVNSFTVVMAHLVAGHYTSEVLQNYLLALPMILLGAFTGFWIDRYINEVVFRRVVLVVLLIIGLRMLFS